MAVVTLSDIHVAFGPEVVLDQLNLQLHPGEKVGMVGANGSGKSTILKLIVVQIEPDMGRVVKQKALRIGYLSQETSSAAIVLLCKKCTPALSIYSNSSGKSRTSLVRWKA